MSNLEIALVLKEIANMLKLKEENPYRLRAYSRGAQIIEGLDDDVIRLVQENRLRNIDGIGDKLAAQIEEIVKTGRCSYLEALEAEFSPVLKAILLIPGVGVKTARIIHENLEIESLSDLREAANAGEVRKLPSMGAKTEEKIIKGIEKLENKTDNQLLGLAIPFAENLLSNIKKIEEVEKAELAGSIRRKCETVEDIDIIVAVNNIEQAKEKICQLPLVRQVLDEGDCMITFLNIIGLKVKIFLSYVDIFPEALFCLTGTLSHTKKIEEKAQGKNQDISCDDVIFNKCIFRTENRFKDEQELYNRLGLQYIPPELREGGKEVDLAEKNQIPDLITFDDIKGDLHIHTDWSDGVNSIDDMIKKAKELGYEYIAITDHSKSLAIAGGLAEKELRKQVEKIQEINELEKKKPGDFKVFSGIEVDILEGGKLDYSDRVLEELDFVIASIHQGFGQKKEHITKRILSAMENEHVKAIGHPLGRLINKREAHHLDFYKLMEKAEETETAFEINSSIDRLDLPYYLIKDALEFEIEFIISTDAHDVKGLDGIKYGIYTARKGFLIEDRVVNARSLKELNFWLEKKSSWREDFEGKDT